MGGASRQSRGAKIREQRDSFERSEIGVPAGKISDFSRGVKRTCKDEQREDGIARRENERNFRDDACPPANGAERRSINAHLNGTDSSHFPASVSVDVGNGSAAHRAAGAPRPKSAMTKNCPFRPNAMRGCDLRSFQCEDEGAYLAYVTEIRDTQKGRKARPSLRLVVETSGLEPLTPCL